MNKSKAKESDFYIILSDFNENEFIKQQKSLGWNAVKIEKRIRINGAYHHQFQTTKILALKQGERILRDLDIVRRKLGKDAHYPDFVCEKGRNIRFVELKSIDLTDELRGDIKKLTERIYDRLKYQKQGKFLQELEALGYDIDVPVVLNISKNLSPDEYRFILKYYHNNHNIFIK